MERSCDEKQMRNDGATRVPAARVFSIGHSHHEAGAFVELLRRAGVDAIADVRSQPFSQRMPQFNRPELQQTLQASDIHYAFLGDTLGGRPQRPSLYDADGRVNYERVRATDSFKRGLEQLASAQEDYRVAMLCAEEDPLDCHRGLMITPALVQVGIYPLHLRGNGTSETTAEMEDRLLDLTQLGGLFALTDEERQQSLAEAYRAWARKKAFRLSSETDDDW
jgi:uncharacterized protein (DUF488 family)